MSSNSDQHRSELETRDNRRWLIGVGISISFGLFGVVMALLSYSNRSPSTPAAAPAAAPADRARTQAKEPDERPREERKRRK